MPTLQGQNILNYFRIRMFIQMLNNNNNVTNQEKYGLEGPRYIWPLKFNFILAIPIC